MEFPKRLGRICSIYGTKLMLEYHLGLGWTCNHQKEARPQGCGSRASFSHYSILGKPMCLVRACLSSLGKFLLPLLKIHPLAPTAYFS
jgi:hypothetical protein